MKNNVILLIISIGLGFFTYYYQELGDRTREVEVEKAQEILNFQAMGEVRSFSLPHVKIRYGDNSYFLDPANEEVDVARVNKFLEQISYVKVKRIIDYSEVNKRSDFITNDELKMTFTFENGSASFILGEKLNFSRDFYLEVEKTINGKTKKQLVVAFNSEVLDQVYAKEEAHRSDHQFNRFKSLYYLSEAFFRDHRIFGPWMNSKWSLQRIYIDNNRNVGHSLLLDKRKTNPAIPNFLELDIKAVQKFEKEFAVLEASKVITFNNEELLSGDKRFAMVIVSSTKGTSRFSLYKDLNSELRGHYIVFPDRKLLYEITKEQADLFKGSVQRFWKLQAWNSLPNELKIKFDDKKYSVRISSGEGIFKANSDKAVAVHLEFQKLIDFLGQRADYWVSGEEVAASYIKQFSIDWGQGEFFLMIRSGEILLYHSQSKQGLVYKIPGRIPFGVVEGDYFK